ncbi:MAG: electron transfer flavoprotein subunit beta/FixA family protein [bacterium]|nr:electron transfer flavoprotein subunit beta/FixA family protein [bacterium]
MLKIIVCVKQVPDTSKVKINPKNGTLIRESIENIMNPDDRHAMETALCLKERYGGTITAITMGPPQAEDVLREAFAMGADDALLITDKRFAGSDSLVTSNILSKVIKKSGKFDIIVTGVEAIDGNTSNVGFQLSEFLGIPLITQIHKIEIQNSSALIERLYGHEYQQIKIDLPILLAVNKDINKVRFSSLQGLNFCFDKEIKRITMDDIGGTEDEYGLKGSPTIVLEYDSFVHKREQEIIEGTLNEKVDGLIHKLKKHNILRY